ncbi:MAG: sensor histidine kinase [Terriglobales bacterium]
MKVKRVANERRRLLLLELAVIVPAVALIAFNIYHLESIKRDRAVEAAFQRDFNQVLLLTEKEMAWRAYRMAEQVRTQFPSPDQAMRPALERLLPSQPEIVHAFVYDAKNGTTMVSQPAQMGDRDFAAEHDRLKSMYHGWFSMEGKEMVEKLWKIGKQDGRPFIFEFYGIPRGGKKVYQYVMMFPLRDAPEDRVSIAGVIWNGDYLVRSFFPEVLNYMTDCPKNPVRDQNDRYRTALMLHAKRDNVPLATSANWDGGNPEVERTMEAAFPGLVLGVKYRGTTIAALSDRFLRTSYATVGALSLLLAGGIFLSYRSVRKEMALAKLKSDFVSNVSHELRTPLSLIRLYAETLEMGRLTAAEKYQEYYQIIRKESERLTALINNILDFSRIEAGRKEYEFRETDIAELVRTTLDSYRYQIQQQGFELAEQIETGLPPVSVDREAIARSLLNLINNAVKYSAQNKYLGVSVQRSNGSVKLQVTDRGIGIPRSEQEKIFEKFYRASDPLVHNTKGSGLGLSLVRHVVTAHGGDVSVESAPGQGSTFTIILPLSGTERSAAQVA